MFKKLRTRLTLFNLLVILALLAIVMLAAFVGSPQNDPTSVNQNMVQVALSGQLPNQRIGSYRNRQGDVARLQLDSAGQVIAVNSDLPLDEADYVNLTAMVLASKENSGILRTEDEREYIYLRVILPPEDGPVIVIQEVISTAASLLNFLARIGPLLVLALVLISFASFFITQRALVPIKAAWQKQVDFTANASHELRTPLAVIQTNLECATDEPSQTIGENAEWFENIKAETGRMAKLVNDLLTLSRSDGSEQVINRMDFDLGEVLSHTAEMMGPQAEKNGLTLQTDIGPQLMTNGDRELLTQLAVILLDNAIKYTPAPGRVGLTAKHTGGNIVLKVTDTGVGIAAEHIDKIFDRFYRANTAHSDNAEGNGLGLALAKWIVEAHGGGISVESTVWQGTVFSVILMPPPSK